VIERGTRAHWAAVAAAGLLGGLLVPGVVLFLLWESASILFGRPSALAGLQWYPLDGLLGLLPLVAGTLLSSLLALLVAVPLGLGTAVALRYHAGTAAQRTGDTVLGVLAGTPSVVYGLVATSWLLPHTGASLASAALVLAVMVVPTFTLLALAALRQLPGGLMESGTTLGLSRSQVIRRLLLVVARPRLAAAASVALARCLGEALAVEMVCGNVAGLPSRLTDPVRTLTTTLVQEFEYAQGEHRAALHLVALVVVLFAAAATSLALHFSHKRLLVS